MPRVTTGLPIALWVLFALFVARVMGQILVGLGVAPFLPPWEEWFSGVLSYPWLFASQMIIIVWLAWICIDVSRQRGVFSVRRPGLGSVLLAFGSIYAVAMILRYAIRMALYPPERWTGGSLPIFFHWVLAAYVLLLGRYHRATLPRPRWDQSSEAPTSTSANTTPTPHDRRD